MLRRCSDVEIVLSMLAVLCAHVITERHLLAWLMGKVQAAGKLQLHWVDTSWCRVELTPAQDVSRIETNATFMDVTS
jgi:hypothetical protein